MEHKLKFSSRHIWGYKDIYAHTHTALRTIIIIIMTDAPLDPSLCGLLYLQSSYTGGQAAV